MKPTQRRHRASQRLRADDGLSILVVSFALAAMLMVAGIAVDGGQAYAQRRSMQNAGDSATMAGTRAVAKVRFEAAAESTILTAVQRKVAEYGVDEYHCWFVLNDAATTRVPSAGADFCADPSLLDAIDVKNGTYTGDSLHIAGVEVEVHDTKTTYFAHFAGFDHTTAKGTATSTIQPYVTGEGSPFIICGREDLPTDAPDGYNILDTSNALQAGAIGQWFPLQFGSGTELRRCGAGSAFKGKGGDEPITLGEWVDGDNGNGFEALIRDQVAGMTPCPPADDGIPPAGCGMVLPIADLGRGNGSHVEMHIVAWAVFNVFGNGTGNVPDECRDNFSPPHPKYCGQLMGQHELTSGQGGQGDPLAHQPYLIKLVK